MAYIARANRLPMSLPTFSRLRARLWLAAAVLLLGATSARADLMLFPTRIVFEKSQRAAQLELINQGRTPETYRLSLVNRRITNVAATAIAAVIISLNMFLLAQTFGLV